MLMLRPAPKREALPKPMVIREGEMYFVREMYRDNPVLRREILVSGIIDESRIQLNVPGTAIHFEVTSCLLLRSVFMDISAATVGSQSRRVRWYRTWVILLLT